MQAVMSERVIRMCALAVKFRRVSARTVMRVYQSKFARAAQELEDHARKLEYCFQRVS